MIVGLIGSAVSIDLTIVDFALTALFLYMIVMQIQNNITFLICILSGIFSLYFLLLTKGTQGIIISTLITSLIGFIIENRVLKYAKDPNNTWILSKIFRPRITKTTKEDVEEEREDLAEQGKDQNVQDNGDKS